MTHPSMRGGPKQCNGKSRERDGFGPQECAYWTLKAICKARQQKMKRVNLSSSCVRSIAAHNAKRKLHFSFVAMSLSHNQSSLMHQAAFL